MLTLPIKKKWFELITLGVKLEEYREPTEYWVKRLRHERYVQDVSRNFCGLRLRIRNGYRKDAPSAIITISKIDTGTGLVEWGAEPGKEYLRLHIAKVEKEVTGNG
ncbi:MAG: ASCH domain-containing protein [Clostridia bacterium]|nr:ASCH domain-containing protein [Clostridia bacterium]